MPARTILSTPLLSVLLFWNPGLYLPRAGRSRFFAGWLRFSALLPALLPSQPVLV
jgi:hypothetical protein